MPEHGTISICVMSHWEDKQYPEFPHPESSHLQGKLAPVASSERLTTKENSDLGSPTASKADKVLGRTPLASVYIPSLAGSRFNVQYSILPPHTDGNLLYFKIFMNGRHITSWGINPRTKPAGQVSRAFFQAEAKWDLRNIEGGLQGGQGPVSRTFYFTDQGSGKLAKAAEDGGLMEIMVFRAKGKRRVNPLLDLFRSQEQLFSSGVIDRPQDVRNYEWLLVDPKDQPHVTFRFHYRSWESLEALQLIPPGYPRTLLPAKKASTIFALHEPPKETHEDKRNVEGYVDENDGEYDGDISSLLDTPASSTSSDTRIREMVKTLDQMLDVNEQSPESQVSNEDSSSASEQVQRQLRLPISTFSIQHKDLDAWERERPLPEAPSHDMSSDHSRKTSASSLAPSISPSLLQWVDRESRNSSPVHFIGTATLINIVPESPAAEQQSQPEDVASDTSDEVYDDHSSVNSVGLFPTPNPFRSDPPKEAVCLPPTRDVRNIEAEQSDKGEYSNAQTRDESFEINSDSIEDPFSPTTPVISEGAWLKGLGSPSPAKKRLQQLHRSGGHFNLRKQEFE